MAALSELALTVACQHSLMELCPPWSTGDSLAALNRQAGRIASRARRARRLALAKLATEIRRHEYAGPRRSRDRCRSVAAPPRTRKTIRLHLESRYVTLRNCTQPAPCWFRIHGVCGSSAILESLEMHYNKTRFCVVMLSLDEWPTKFVEWNDGQPTPDECWRLGFTQYGF